MDLDMRMNMEYLSDFMSGLSKGLVAAGTTMFATGLFNVYGKEGSAFGVGIGAVGIGAGAALEMVEGLYGGKKKKLVVANVHLKKA